MTASVSGSVREFLDKVTPARRRRDAETLVALMQRATGEQPQLWGTIVAFGSYHYKYDSGREGDAPAAGFAPRKASTTVYLADGVAAHESKLRRLGPHTTGVACVYLKDLEQIDLELLEEVVGSSYSKVTSGTFGKPARDGAED